MLGRDLPEVLRNQCQCTYYTKPLIETTFENTFSKVSVLVHLLHKAITETTFENSGWSRQRRCKRMLGLKRGETCP